MRLLLSASLLVCYSSDRSAAAEDSEVGPAFLLSLGGKLYDDLWAVVDESPPASNNPALAGSTSVAEREGWRCVTCHGWDYGGATIDGKSFPRLWNLRGVEQELIEERLRDPDHPFPVGELTDVAVQVLAFFISEGQYEASDYLNEDGPIGNPEFGQAIFEGACINCHGLDGTQFLRGERGDRESLGTVVRTKPTQALHRILNGVPGTEMLSLRFLAEEHIADLIAYVHTLETVE
jgi:thiosulfate dehydrogenase